MKKIFVIFVGCLCVMPSFAWIDESVIPDYNTCKSYVQSDFDLIISGDTDDGKRNRISVSDGERIQKTFKKEHGQELNSSADRAKVDAYINEYAEKIYCDDLWAKQSGGTNNNNSSSADGGSDKASELLNKARAGKSVDVAYLCQNRLGNTGKNNNVDDCEYISPVFGICDTHAYNLGLAQNISNETRHVRDRVALKTTVVSQQMYKQYEYLAATLRRIKTQLQKSVLTAQLQMAGAQSDGSSGSGGSSANKNSAYASCLGKSRDDALYCLRQNYSAIERKIDSKQCGKAEKTQLAADAKALSDLLTKDYKVDGLTSNCAKEKLVNVSNCKECLGSYAVGLINLQEVIDDREAQRRGGYRN